MKLDKIKFATLITYISNIVQRQTIDSTDINMLDELIDIDVEPVALPLNLSAIEGLMQYMAQGTQKIEAIRQYRSLTGFGLKDSKDAVEKYWIAKKDEG